VGRDRRVLLAACAALDEAAKQRLEAVKQADVDAAAATAAREAIEAPLRARRLHAAMVEGAALSGAAPPGPLRLPPVVAPPALSPVEQGVCNSAEQGAQGRRGGDVAGELAGSAATARQQSAADAALAAARLSPPASPAPWDALSAEVSFVFEADGDDGSSVATALSVPLAAYFSGGGRRDDVRDAAAALAAGKVAGDGTDRSDPSVDEKGF